MLITISGLSGSGKSTTAKLLAKKLKYRTIDIGVLFRRLAKEYKMDVTTFGEFAEKHPEIDQKLDSAMIQYAKSHPKTILQGRLAGHMTARENLKAIRIWINADEGVRAERIAKREHIPQKQALSELKKRDKDNLNRYLKIYGLDLNDLSLYDIVVQTNELTPQKVVNILLTELKKYGRARGK